MAQYHHNVNSHHRSVRARRIKRISIAGSALLIALFLFVAVDWAIQFISPQEEVVTSQETAVYAENVTLLRSKYFQFRSPDGWTYATSLSKDDKFVYVREDDSQVEQKLEVFINRPKFEQEADFEASYVLPITRDTVGSISTVGKVSPHCKESWPIEQGAIPKRIIHGSVEFLCHPTSILYNVLIGDSGGDEVLEYTMQDGTKLNLTILFSNYSAYPNANDLYDIMKGFTVL